MPDPAQQAGDTKIADDIEYIVKPERLEMDINVTILVSNGIYRLTVIKELLESRLAFFHKNSSDFDTKTESRAAKNEIR